MALRKLREPRPPRDWPDTTIFWTLGAELTVSDPFRDGEGMYAQQYVLVTLRKAGKELSCYFPAAQLPDAKNRFLRAFRRGEHIRNAPIVFPAPRPRRRS